MSEESKISKAQQKAVHKYVKNNYDRLEITVPKGKKDTIKTYVATKGESLNSFVNRAIDETMERDSPAATPENTINPLSILENERK